MASILLVDDVLCDYLPVIIETFRDQHQITGIGSFDLFRTWLAADRKLFRPDVILLDLYMEGLPLDNPESIASAKTIFDVLSDEELAELSNWNWACFSGMMSDKARFEAASANGRAFNKPAEFRHFATIIDVLSAS